MPSLRNLLSTLEPPKIGNPVQTFEVFRDNDSQNNGGRCCRFCVPQGVTSVTVEMWGAGAPGQGAKCCERAGVSPSSGSYAVKQIDVTEGTCLTLCAGGTGCCSRCCGIGNSGKDSFVLCNGNTVGRAEGGYRGCSEMTRSDICSGYTCCYAQLNNNGCGSGDISMAGHHGQFFANRFCKQGEYELVAGGMSSGKHTLDYCTGNGVFRCGCQAICSRASFPAGAGATATSCGGECVQGQSGGAGLIFVRYQ